MKNHTARIDFLKQREREIREALAAEQMKLAKRRQRDTERLERILGAAVLRTAELSPEFKLMIAQTALCNVDDKARRMLIENGWL